MSKPEDKQIHKLWETLVSSENSDDLDIDATYRVIEKEEKEEEFTLEKMEDMGKTVAIDYSSEFVETSGSFCNNLNDKYANIVEIGKGGMAVVYQAEQTNLHRQIAIKRMLTSKSAKRFIAESIITANLDHPNIVPVYDLERTEGGNVFLTMKLVKGICWKDLLHPQSEVEKEKAKEYNQNKHLQILLHVCNAIAFAHSKEIIHCDLKPANIMIGEFGEVFVMDWGLSVYIGKNKKDALVFHRSEINFPMGTPSYMPKELAEGTGDKICEATDIYLLGAILYEILTLKPPHQGKSFWEVLAKINKEKEFSFPVKIPEYLRKICYKALRPEICDRYSTIQEFKADLEKFIDHSKSISLCETAKEDLAKCLEEKQKINEDRNLESLSLYNRFSRTSASFEKALDLWKENEEAKVGLDTALLEYANLAEQQRDLGLAEVILKQYNEDKNNPQINKQIDEISSFRKGLAWVKNLGLFLFRSVIFYFFYFFCINKAFHDPVIFKLFMPLLISASFIPYFILHKNIYAANFSKKSNAELPLFLIFLTTLIYSFSAFSHNFYVILPWVVILIMSFIFFTMFHYYILTVDCIKTILRTALFRSSIFICIIATISMDFFMQKNATLSTISPALSTYPAILLSVCHVEVLISSIHKHYPLREHLILATLSMTIALTFYAVLRIYFIDSDSIALGMMVLLVVCMAFIADALVVKQKVKNRFHLIITRFSLTLIMFVVVTFIATSLKFTS